MGHQLFPLYELEWLKVFSFLRGLPLYFEGRWRDGFLPLLGLLGHFWRRNRFLDLLGRVASHRQVYLARFIRPCATQRILVFLEDASRRSIWRIGSAHFMRDDYLRCSIYLGGADWPSTLLRFLVFFHKLVRWFPLNFRFVNGNSVHSLHFWYFGDVKILLLHWFLLLLIADDRRRRILDILLARIRCCGDIARAILFCLLILGKRICISFVFE